MESGATDDIYETPRHPYTRALLDAILRIEAGDRWRRLAQQAADAETDADAGGIRSQGTAGCIYAASCPERFAPCRTIAPPVRSLRPGHDVACHLYDRTIPDTTGDLRQAGAVAV
jgi:oligopeptide/dipeptide ABC transporter ATP-binding protein